MNNEKVMVVEDEEFILQGILCINDWASMDMEVVHTAITEKKHWKNSEKSR